eukprot:CAMPEP_0114238986 /NCGR_PEP_ID=MMETSP0058-20121206/8211_1 /TAXON_ID=36894 /ORGANISM="Pyramimonas parkeae, CCMP726" /LENGTH=249 /DNA_ID=CAMNT_0001351121 /DNA_START=607 /DNA_END=1355 /DNA_ORIENTATION=-
MRNDALASWQPHGYLPAQSLHFVHRYQRCLCMSLSGFLCFAQAILESDFATRTKLHGLLQNINASLHEVNLRVPLLHRSLQPLRLDNSPAARSGFPDAGWDRERSAGARAGAGRVPRQHLRGGEARAVEAPQRVSQNRPLSLLMARKRKKRRSNGGGGSCGGGAAEASSRAGGAGGSQRTSPDAWCAAKPGGGLEGAPLSGASLTSNAGSGNTGDNKDADVVVAFSAAVTVVFAVGAGVDVEAVVADVD